MIESSSLRVICPVADCSRECPLQQYFASLTLAEQAVATALRRRAARKETTATERLDTAMRLQLVEVGP